MLYCTAICVDNDTQEERPVPEADKATLRNDLVPAMIALSAPTDKPVRAQVAESISLIASVDFPEPWTDLIDVSVHAVPSYMFVVRPDAIRYRNWSVRYQAQTTLSTSVFSKRPIPSSSRGERQPDPTRSILSSITSCRDSASRS